MIFFYIFLDSYTEKDCRTVVEKADVSRYPVQHWPTATTKMNP
jgi:hypothetical protein